MGTRTAEQLWSVVSAAWCPQQRSRLMPSPTQSSNLHVIRRWSALLCGVERAAMVQRCRPQSYGPGLLCAAARFGFAVLKNNLCLLEGVDFTPAASATTKVTMKTLFTFRTVIFGYPYSSTIMTGVSAACCPQQRSRLMPSRTHSSNLYVI